MGCSSPKTSNPIGSYILRHHATKNLRADAQENETLEPPRSETPASEFPFVDAIFIPIENGASPRRRR
jgi:hypothetical protein